MFDHNREGSRVGGGFDFPGLALLSALAQKGDKVRAGHLWGRCIVYEFSSVLPFLDVGLEWDRGDVVDRGDAAFTAGAEVVVGETGGFLHGSINGDAERFGLVGDLQASRERAREQEAIYGG
jgi:hypothetical protein